MSLNFAVIGVGGFVAPRHLKAIRDTGHRLVAATDPRDSVGILDQYALDARYFPEIERFDRYLEKLRRAGDGHRVRFVSVCSPNYLHDAHVRLAFRVGADAICEKPLVINPWNLDQLQTLEEETGRRVYTVLQLRLHPALLALKQQIDRDPGRNHEVVLTYVTGRGPWYYMSWKGTVERSGGLASNIGVHFFDVLGWLFGRVESSSVHLNEPKRMSGTLVLERARAKWFLSLDPADLPFTATAGGRLTHRSLQVDGQDVEFSDGFADLHTRVYDAIVAGSGIGTVTARPSIELAYRIRTAQVTAPGPDSHPMLALR